MLTTRNTPHSREVTSCSGNQEVSRILCKPIIFTKAYSWAKHELSSQPPIVFKSHFKIIVQLQLILPINPFPSFFCQNTVFKFPSFMLATCHPCITVKHCNIWRGMEVINLFSVRYFPVSSHFPF